MLKLVESRPAKNKSNKIKPQKSSPQSLNHITPSKLLSFEEAQDGLQWFTHPESVDWEARRSDQRQRWLTVPNELKEEERLDVAAIATGVRRVSRYAVSEDRR